MGIDKIKIKIVPILIKHGAIRAGIFGSAARGKLSRSSDIDILVQFDNDRLSLLDFIGIQIELEKALKRKVNLGEYDAIKPLIKDAILKEQIAIL